MSAASIAEKLGNAQLEGRDWRCNCPVCNHHNLALSDSGKLLLVKCFNGCANKDVLAELGRLGLYGKNGNGAEHAETRAEHEANAKSANAKRQTRNDNALDMWRNSVPAADTMVATYLASRLLLDPVPPALRLAPAIWHKEAAARFPAMVGLVEHPEHGAVGIRAVYLNRLDASVRFTTEPRKRSFGALKGGCVRLGPAGPVLAVSEGIEDALTFTQATGTPSWAAITATGIQSFVPPPLAETSTIILIEDNDQTGRGAVAAAARRLAKAGYAIKIARPKVGKDLNEALLALGFHEPLCTIEDYQPDGAAAPDPDAALSGTEDEVALEFSRRHSDELRYVKLWGQWLYWDNAIWQRVQDLKVFHLVRRVAREFSHLHKDKKLGRDAATAAIERMARNDPRHDRTPDMWNTDPEIYGTATREEEQP